jgi:hypothetical protein
LQESTIYTGLTVKMMNSWKLSLIVVPVTVMLLMQAACTAASSLQITGPELTAREFTGDLNTKSSMAVLTGTARNTKDVTARNCVLTVTFYDAQNNNIGVASATRESLGPGETWSFTVQLTNPDAWKARRYELKASNQ